MGVSQVVLLDHTTDELIARFDVPEAAGLALHRGSLYYTEGEVVRRMPLDLDEAVAEARASLTRTWTPQECDEYAIDSCSSEERTAS